MAVTDAELLAYNETIIEMLKERYGDILKKRAATRQAPRRPKTKLLVDYSIKGSTSKGAIPSNYFEALKFWNDQLGREKKSNLRAKGAFLQNLPENNLEVLRQIVDGDMDARDIAIFIKAHQGQSARLGGAGHYYDKVTKQVGHAVTGLNLIPDAMEEWLQPFDGPNATEMRLKFLNLAKEKGYNLGDNFLNFIDPAAHKPFNEKLSGLLADRYGLKKSDIPENVYGKIKQWQAHADLFGRETGRPIPIGIEGIKGIKPEEFLKAITPWLDLPKMTNENATTLNNIIQNYKDLPTEDFEQAILKLPEVSDNKTLMNLNEQLAQYNEFGKSGHLRIDELGKVSASSPIEGPIKNVADIKLFEKSGHLLNDAQKAAKAKGAGSLYKKLLKLSPVPVAGLALSPSIVAAAEQRYEENPSIPNWTQLQLERISQKASQVSAAAVVPTVVPEPATSAAGLFTMAAAETVDAFASGGSLMIDAARWAVNNPDGIRNFMPKLPMQTNEVLEDYDERAKDYADKGGWDVSGYTF